jgi:hypothetical protein
MFGSGSPETFRKPTAPLSKRNIAWSIKLYVPGINIFKSTMEALPGGTAIVWIARPYKQP